MRLINADKLKDWLYNMPYYNDSINDRTYIRDHIDEMPTVDAIPVEWIKQFIKKDNIDIIHKVGVVDMVEKWKLHPIDFEISSEDAIPVEWIKNFIKRTNDTDGMAVAEMLSDWETENE